MSKYIVSDSLDSTVSIEVFNSIQSVRAGLCGILQFFNMQPAFDLNHDAFVF